MQTLATIESFVQSARTGSFSAAARQLGVTPAAVSKNVAKLESGLRVRLFQRTTRRLTLTESGELFLREAEAGLRALETAIEHVTGAREPAGTLRVSLSPSFGQEYVLSMLGGFLDRYPALRVDWDFDNRQVDLVGEGFDAAIGAIVELGGGLVQRELARAHIIAVASPVYLARRGTPKLPADLTEHDGIVRRSPLTGRISSWPFRNASGEQAALELRPRAIFNDTEAICRGALQGLGIGLISMPHAVQHLERGALVRVLPRWYADAGPIVVYYGGQKLLPTKTRAFVDALVAYFEKERLAERFRADVAPSRR